jgi:hypothetical protein
VSTRAWLTTLFLAACAGWAATGAGFLAYANWFSETEQGGGDAVKWSLVVFILIGVGATFAFVATSVFALLDRARGRA